MEVVGLEALAVGSGAGVASSVSSYMGDTAAVGLMPLSIETDPLTSLQLFFFAAKFSVSHLLSG